MKKFLLWLSIVIVFILIGWFGNTAYHLPKNSNPISLVKPTPLLKYTIENLSQNTFEASKIEIVKTLSEEKTFTSYEFEMNFSPDLGKETKKVSGLINIPDGDGPFPVIVMFRGYADQKAYVIGTGTQPSAKVFADSGYITVAPDFLGYGDSSSEAGNIFESRFQTYVTAATVLKSVNSINKWDGKNVFIWAHSNGGQIALATLEITGAVYPTVLWAPVSLPFPASILYYLAEADDGGKFLIDKLSEFGETYDSKLFSPTNYYDKIKAPINLYQGTADTAVPYWLTDALSSELKAATVSATYKKYSGNDHNMRPNWDLVVQDNLKFYNEQTK